MPPTAAEKGLLPLPPGIAVAVSAAEPAPADVMSPTSAFTSVGGWLRERLTLDESRRPQRVRSLDAPQDYKVTSQLVRQASLTKPLHFPTVYDDGAPAASAPMVALPASVPPILPAGGRSRSLGRAGGVSSPLAVRAGGAPSPLASAHRARGLPAVSAPSPLLPDGGQPSSWPALAPSASPPSTSFPPGLCPVSAAHHNPLLSDASAPSPKRKTDALSCSSAEVRQTRSRSIALEVGADGGARHSRASSSGDEECRGAPILATRAAGGGRALSSANGHPSAKGARGKGARGRAGRGAR